MANTLIVLLLTLTTIQCLSFQTGVAHLTDQASSSPSLTNYTLPLDTQSSNLVLSLTSFTFNAMTTCFITNSTAQLFSFSCMGNIHSVSYLHHERNPLIFSSIYSHYFPSANLNYSELWTPPVNTTVIENIKIAVLLCGFQLATNGQLNNTLIDIKIINGNIVNINRSLNTRAVNLSFIMMQDQLPQGLTFRSVDIGSSPQISMPGALTDYINFWGINSLKVAASGNISSLTAHLSSSNDNVLAIASFSITSNMAASGVFFQKNQIKDCNYRRFFSTANSSCVDHCSYPHAIMLWNSTNNNSLRYCLSSSALS